MDSDYSDAPSDVDEDLPRKKRKKNYSINPTPRRGTIATIGSDIARIDYSAYSKFTFEYVTGLIDKEKNIDEVRRTYFNKLTEEHQRELALATKLGFPPLWKAYPKGRAHIYIAPNGQHFEIKKEACAFANIDLPE